MIYLDHAASTFVYNEVQRVVEEYNTKLFFNPSSRYDGAFYVQNRLNDARCFFLDSIGFDGRVVFTSGATESNNFALKCGVKSMKKKLIISAGEHASVYDTAISMRGKGIEVKIIPLNPNGTVNTDILFNEVDEQTALVSIIHVNNETGAINNIAKISKNIKTRFPTVLFHSDGVQGYLKERLDMSYVDLYSVSGHKLHAPKGVGALFIRQGLTLSPLIHGGAQQDKLRSGTENVSGIMGFLEACRIYRDKYNANHMQSLKAHLIEMMSVKLPKARINALGESSPHIVSITIPDIKAEVLMRMLEKKGIYIGLGASCNSNSKGNRILEALGCSKEDADSSIRISMDASNTLKDIDETVLAIQEISTKHNI